MAATNGPIVLDDSDLRVPLGPGHGPTSYASGNVILELNASKLPGTSGSNPSSARPPSFLRNSRTSGSCLAISPSGTGVLPSGNSTTRIMRPPFRNNVLRLAPISFANTRPDSGVFRPPSKYLFRPGFAPQLKNPE